MPVIVQENLPAITKLQRENLSFIIKTQKSHQADIKLLILNLMPLKTKTEKHLLRVLSHSPFLIDVVWMNTASYQSKNTKKEHLSLFYQTFDQIKDQKYDGMIITGAPIENMPFEQVTYWNELTQIMEWSKKNVGSVLYLCWAAQAALHHFYHINKYPLEKKCCGVFEHVINTPKLKLFRGFDPTVYVPHSRYTEIRKNDMMKEKHLKIICESPKVGIHMAMANYGRMLFLTGHPEYDAKTLKEEYIRDLKKGLEPAIPENYFPNDQPHQQPKENWKTAASLLFSNWLHYYVYKQNNGGIDL